LLANLLRFGMALDIRRQKLEFPTGFFHAPDSQPIPGHEEMEEVFGAEGSSQ